VVCGSAKNTCAERLPNGISTLSSLECHLYL
jgi:hypothetical protein